MNDTPAAALPGHLRAVADSRFGGRPHPLSGLAKLLLVLARRERDKRAEEARAAARREGDLPQDTSELSHKTRDAGGEPRGRKRRPGPPTEGSDPAS